MRKNYANYLEISETSPIFASELRNNKSEKIENTVRRNKVRQAERLPTKRQVRVRIAKKNLEFYGTSWIRQARSTI